MLVIKPVQVFFSARGAAGNTNSTHQTLFAEREETQTPGVNLRAREAESSGGDRRVGEVAVVVGGVEGSGVGSFVK